MSPSPVTTFETTHLKGRRGRARAVDLIDRSRPARLPRALEAHRPTPLPPLHKGGKKKAGSRKLRNEFGRNARVVQPQLYTTPGLPSQNRAKAFSKFVRHFEADLVDWRHVFVAVSRHRKPRSCPRPF